MRAGPLWTALKFSASMTLVQNALDRRSIFLDGAHSNAGDREQCSGRRRATDGDRPQNPVRQDAECGDAPAAGFLQAPGTQRLFDP